MGGRENCEIDGRKTGYISLFEAKSALFIQFRMQRSELFAVKGEQKMGRKGTSGKRRRRKQKEALRPGNLFMYATHYYRENKGYPSLKGRGPVFHHMKGGGLHRRFGISGGEMRTSAKMGLSHRK